MEIKRTSTTNRGFAGFPRFFFPRDPRVAGRRNGLNRGSRVGEKARTDGPLRTVHGACTVPFVHLANRDMEIAGQRAMNEQITEMLRQSNIQSEAIRAEMEEAKKERALLSSELAAMRSRQRAADVRDEASVADGSPYRQPGPAKKHNSGVKFDDDNDEKE